MKPWTVTRRPPRGAAVKWTTLVVVGPIMEWTNLRGIEDDTITTAEITSMVWTNQIDERAGGRDRRIVNAGEQRHPPVPFKEDRSAVWMAPPTAEEENERENDLPNGAVETGSK